MTNTDFIEKLVVLTDKLDRISSSKPYDQDAYNSVVTRIQMLQLERNRSRRRRPIFFAILIWILLGILIGLVFRILFLT